MEKMKRISFNRNEFSGAFGDIGTDLPLITALILAFGLNITNVLVVFGFFQILTALTYRIPMPVQPLKAMATIMLTQKLAPNLLYGAGLAIGITMLFLTLTGLLQWLADRIPKSVIRGIQFGLGLSLAQLAIRNYIVPQGLTGLFLGAAGSVLTLAFLGNKKYPPVFFILALGLAYILYQHRLETFSIPALQLTLPRFQIPAREDILSGFILLALPQIPLSIGNSILATRQTAHDFFPGSNLTIRKIGLSYSLMNIVNPFFGGLPTCHGSGGLAGHYIFGGRTGGSVIIYGLFYLISGLFFSQISEDWLLAFPLPLLGVLLFFEALFMMMLSKDMMASKSDLFIIFLVGGIIVAVPYGYLAGMIAGTLLSKFIRKYWSPAE